MWKQSEVYGGHRSQQINGGLLLIFGSTSSLICLRLEPNKDEEQSTGRPHKTYYYNASSLVHYTLFFLVTCISAICTNTLASNNTNCASLVRIL